MAAHVERRSGIVFLLACLAGAVLAGLVMLYSLGAADDGEAPSAERDAAVRIVTVGEPDSERLYLAAVGCIAVGGVAAHWIGRLALDEVRDRRGGHGHRERSR